MIPYWSLDGSALYQGNVLDVLRALETGSVHMSVTSPPYWSLRSYPCPPVEWEPVRYAPMAGMPEIEIAGCDPGCRHEWGEERTVKGENWEHGPNAMNQPANGARNPRRDGAIKKVEISQGSWCHLCGGWRGSLGLEPSVEMFVGHIVLIWRELRRVLRDDGTSWVNFGDSYAASGGHTAQGHNSIVPKSQENVRTFSAQKVASGLKPKDLIGVPWRVAFALQADGWYLRSDIVWAKGLSFCPTYSGSCMPESVRDRPTKAHEYVFLLSKQARYFYDGDAVREQGGDGSDRWGGPVMDLATDKAFGGDAVIGQRANRPMRTFQYNGGRNLRTVWTISPGNFKGAHFATFSPALVEPMIKAGTSERGCCPKCGASWERVTEREQDTLRPKSRPVGASRGISPSDFRALGQPQQGSQIVRVETTGWRPTCKHYDDLYRRDFPQARSARKRWQRAKSGNWWKRTRKRAGLAHWPVEPCTILDPFLGSGTTADVARQLGRRWIGIELSQAYCDDHIIPRLSEPLIEWAEEQAQPEQPEPVQMELL